MGASNTTLVQDVALHQLGAGEAGLASGLAQVEALFNRDGLNARFNAMPTHARDMITSNFDLMSRHQFEAAIPPPRKPKV